MKSQARQKFRIYHSKQKRLIYLACEKNDTSICFNEWGWEALEHFTGKWESLAREDDGSILMEFTGLFDVNNRLIFEGDMVRINSGFLKSNSLYVVAWNEEYSCFAFMEGSKFLKFLDKLTIVTMKINDIEIVSNIFGVEDSYNERFKSEELNQDEE